MRNLNYGLAIPAVVMVIALLFVSSLFPAQSQALAGGGINTIKSLCVVAGLPMMFIYAILVKHLMHELGAIQVAKEQEQTLPLQEVVTDCP
ncbi:hypothetical protein BCT86_16770 [Vibrio breoganii]|uniref:Uncharacterized protein n=1 Tax=Vibrio breoganii TaxID=553239 RepID=A0AAN0XXC1_9VIBR|nr:hypothetical protein [Vibrio breoganii]ANO34217.1 hypothetical protein A6E01_13470 [Vibrio breoganii]MDN3715341.1 hypothetical protein [Vibrio breoganii]PMG80499.1 hypothetical protein BCU83_10705 [Vibrio breoganii]PMK42832.1 hypothetical protein BCU00_11560 [Vibrio breoganii]PML02694.1 hypothetical protein BCT86_16770 [Vibrio breoganii]